MLRPIQTPHSTLSFTLDLIYASSAGWTGARQSELALSIEEIPLTHFCTMPLSNRTHVRVLEPGRGCPLGMQLGKARDH